jgi:hypothetical protein
MNDESKQATRLLGAIAESNHGFLTLANDLRSRPDVANVSYDFECRRNDNYFEFGTGPAYAFDWYVDVSLRNGNSIWWELNVYWDASHWVIETRVEVPGEHGPNTLEEFPDRRAETIDEFIDQLGEATSELIASARMPTTRVTT